MRLCTDLGGELDINQVLKRSSQQLPEQTPNPVTTKFVDQL